VIAVLLLLYSVIDPSTDMLALRKKEKQKRKEKKKTTRRGDQKSARQRPGCRAPSNKQRSMGKMASTYARLCEVKLPALMSQKVASRAVLHDAQDHLVDEIRVHGHVLARDHHVAQETRLEQHLQDQEYQ
jgi:hypothetical protein